MSEKSKHRNHMFDDYLQIRFSVFTIADSALAALVRRVAGWASIFTSRGLGRCDKENIQFEANEKIYLEQRFGWENYKNENRA